MTKPATQERESITVYVAVETLTDGSKVWNVLVGDTIIHAYSEYDANALADVMANAINDYSCDVARVRDLPQL